MTRPLDERIAAALTDLASEIPTRPPSGPALDRRQLAVTDADAVAPEGVRDSYVPASREHRRDHNFARAAVVLLVAAVVGLVIAGARQIDEPAVGTSETGTPAPAIRDEEPSDADVEADVITSIEEFEASTGAPIAIASGSHPTHGEWNAWLRISGDSLSNGFCLEGTSGGSCGVGADLRRFGLFSRDGRPVPMLMWGAPRPITAVEVEWDDGTVEIVDVVRPPGEDYGFAATVMPAAGVAFRSVGLDETGATITEAVDRQNPYTVVGP